MREYLKGYGLSVVFHGCVFLSFGVFASQSIVVKPQPSQPVMVSFVMEKPVELAPPPVSPAKPEPKKALIPEKKEIIKKEIPQKIQKKEVRKEPVRKTNPEIKKVLEPPAPPLRQEVRQAQRAMPVQAKQSVVERYISINLEKVKSLIQENLRYPRMARKMGWTGKVFVSFTILQSGRAVGMSIVNSSGYKILDNEVLRTIEMVSSFPLPKQVTTLTVPVSFNLS